MEISSESFFVQRAKQLIEIARQKQIEAFIAINDVSRHIQSKYPEVIAEFMPSDGGIIFIGLEGTDVETQEFYGIENIIERLGER